MRRALLMAFILVAAGLSAVDVDEEELEALGTRDFDFINYEGPYETINTIEQIVGIGRSLGTAVRDGRTDFVIDGRYRVIRAIDPTTNRLRDADIIVPLPTSRVDHINNLRRIISGYLQAAYDYRSADADLLARWVTIYNAVVRGDIEFFTDRYKQVVLSHLTRENAGLARRYDEWPGRSRIVIPLSSVTGPGVIGTVDPAEIAADRVIEELRSLPDRGIDDRQEMVELTERVIDEREERIAAEQAEIAAVERRLDEETERVAEERERIADLPDDERPAAEAVIAEREAEIAAEREEAERRRAELADEQREVAELVDRVRAERELIARDARALLDERAIADEVRGLDAALAPIYFLQVREVGPAVFGRLVQINPATGVIVNRSAEDAIVSREYQFFGEHLLVVTADGDNARLATFSVASLAEHRRSAAEVFIATSVGVFGTPQRVYAVVRDGGQWYLGRFNDELALVDRSIIAVNPYTTIAFGGNRIWVQTSDDRIIALATDTLRIAP
ncbi:MAG: hypothetical protein EA382_10475 [Spirochaetaceae bacterium]|nr:MAG: hypothetical protein EA382_10475 [Spirochaetaceae bacterium]